jgi:NADH:ubiquinone oxidoreductase subunit 6 (subunit J)
LIPSYIFELVFAGIAILVVISSKSFVARAIAIFASFILAYSGLLKAAQDPVAVTIFVVVVVGAVAVFVIRAVTKARKKRLEHNEQQRGGTIFNQYFGG